MEEVVTEATIPVRVFSGLRFQKGIIGIGRVELRQWGLSGNVVVHHVHDHRDAPLVRLFDKLLESLRRPVGLVKGQMGIGIVAPAVVAAKVGDRHKLHGIYPKPVQVVERIAQHRKRPLLHEVTKQKLVDHEVFPLRGLEAGEVEGVALLIRANHGDQIFSLVLWIGLQSRIDIFANSSILRSANLVGEGIGGTNRTVHEVLKIVLVLPT